MGVASKVERAVQGEIWLSKKHGRGLKEKELRATPYPVIGLDIEADAGTAEPFLLGMDGEDWAAGISINSWEDCLQALMKDRLQRTVNFFYNLQYDFEGMARFVEQEVAIRLISGEAVGIDYDGRLIKHPRRGKDIRVKYIPRKAFTIQRGKSTWTYFDAWQYYMTSLEKALEKNVPGEAKGDFDASKTSKERYLWDAEYRRRVGDYCLQDARGCRLLAEIIVDGANQFVNTREFYSSASVSEKYFRSIGFRIPPVPKSVMKAFMRTYHGGRFEMVKRGCFEGATLIDIKSAYPHAMANMPILTDDFRVKLGKERDADALFGAYEIETYIPEDWYISPLATKVKNTLCFPVGEYKTDWVDGVTLDLLDALGVDYRVKGSWELHQAEWEYELREPILKLFGIKEDKRNPPAKRYASKINMNGLYGKLIQLIDDVEIAEVTEIAEVDTLEYHELISLYDRWYKRVHTGNFRTGALFSPWYAGFTTSYARKQMFEKALEIGPERVITMHTDSIAYLGHAPESGTKLGEWEVEEMSGESLVGCRLRISKCGFYEVQTPKGQTKIRSRGVGRTDSISKEEYSVKRRYGMNRAIRRDYDLMNVIGEVVLRQDLNADKKRIWDSPLEQKTFKDWEYIDSNPVRMVA